MFDGPHADRWDWRPLEQLLEEPLKTGISRPEASGSHTSCLTLAAIKGGRLGTAARKPVDITEEEARKNWVRPGAFYVVRGNGQVRP